MTLQELKNKSDTKLVEFWNALLTKQESYRLKRDDYFQLLVTNPVVDGVDTTWEVRHPSDQLITADVDFTFNSPVPFRIRVDSWGTKPSRGFTATAIVELPNGRRFTRSRSYTDTRERTRDVISGEFPDLVYGEWYLSGAIPVIETTDWVEIIDPI